MAIRCGDGKTLLTRGDTAAHITHIHSEVWPWMARTVLRHQEHMREIEQELRATGTYI